MAKGKSNVSTEVIVGKLEKALKAGMEPDDALNAVIVEMEDVIEDEVVRRRIRNWYGQKTYGEMFSSGRSRLYVSSETLIDLLNKHGKITEVARELGVTPPTVARKISDYGLVSVWMAGDGANDVEMDEDDY